jgi:glycosyl transferase family 87
MIAVFISIVLGLTTAAVVITHHLAAPAPFHPDFGVFWDIAVLALKHPELTYDPASRTLLGTWAYPPTALVVLTPFAMLPFPVAYLIWVLGSLTLYLYFATWLFDKFKPLGIALIILAPPVWTVTLFGQTTLPMGALVLGALLVMPERKLLAGAMLGIAATIKPQTMIMMPVALLAIREWRVIASATTAAIAISSVATIIFGFDVWFDWIGVFPRLFADPVMHQVQISLWPLTSRSFAILLLVALAACFIVWATFRATDRADHRLVAAVGGAWLVSPYIPVYELTMIVPAVVAFALQEIGASHPIIKRWRSYVGAVAVFATPLAIVCAPIFLFLNTLVVGLPTGWAGLPRTRILRRFSFSGKGFPAGGRSSRG